MELRMTQNAAMSALAPRVPRRLDKGLRALLDEGVELAGDHVVLTRNAASAPPWRRTTFPVAAYYEGAINHVHVPQELQTLRAQANPLGHALRYARALAHLLASAHSDRAFDVWLTGDEATVVRFHQRRDGEDGWERALTDTLPWLGVHVG